MITRTLTLLTLSLLALSSSTALAQVVDVDVDASRPAGTLAPLWSDHYELSYLTNDYVADAPLNALIRQLKPRSWRCSVGRWEVGSTVPGGDSLDPNVLRKVEREFYRGPNTLAGADDPRNYDFRYLDAQLKGIAALGAEPFLCFDYMPFTLSSRTNPNTAYNIGKSDPSHTFSNGIRSAPPADPQVYARVVRNVIRHVRGKFAGRTDYGIRYIEIGNEPNLVDADGRPYPLFWTGTSTQFVNMYAAIVKEVNADPALTGIKLGAASFANMSRAPAPNFADRVLSEVARQRLRLDFVSYHSYSDSLDDHAQALDRLTQNLRSLGLSPEIVNGEWSRHLKVGPVFSRLEQGLFRAKALILFQLYGVKIAHEALLVDPTSGAADSLGLLRRPAAHKPASLAYLALGRMTGATRALSTTAPPSVYAMAGQEPTSGRIAVTLVIDAPPAGQVAARRLRLTRIPPRARGWTLRRWEVTDAGGLRLAAERTLGSVGALTDAVSTSVDRLIVWELVPR